MVVGRRLIGRDYMNRGADRRPTPHLSSEASHRGVAEKFAACEMAHAGGWRSDAFREMGGSPPPVAATLPYGSSFRIVLTATSEFFAIPCKTGITLKKLARAHRNIASTNRSNSSSHRVICPSEAGTSHQEYCPNNSIDRSIKPVTGVSARPAILEQQQSWSTKEEVAAR
jgi:hypothetical protein